MAPVNRILAVSSLDMVPSLIPINSSSQHMARRLALQSIPSRRQPRISIITPPLNSAPFPLLSSRRPLRVGWLPVAVECSAFFALPFAVGLCPTPPGAPSPKSYLCSPLSLVCTFCKLSLVDLLGFVLFSLSTPSYDSHSTASNVHSSKSVYVAVRTLF